MKPFRLDQMMASIETCLAQQQVQCENVVLKRQEYEETIAEQLKSIEEGLAIGK